MGEQTGIGWTEKTWNPWHGCTKISPGCKFCYMYRDKARYGQDPTKIVRSKTTFIAPLSWRDPAMVFTCSWSDFFIAEADEWREGAWAVIRETMLSEDVDDEPYTDEMMSRLYPAWAETEL